MLAITSTRFSRHIVFNEGGQWLTLSIHLYLYLFAVRVWLGYPLPGSFETLLKLPINGLKWFDIITLGSCILFIAGLMLWTP